MLCTWRSPPTRRCGSPHRPHPRVDAVSPHRRPTTRRAAALPHTNGFPLLQTSRRRPASMSGAPPSLTGTGVACHPPDPSPSQGWRSPPSLPAEQVAGRAPAVPPWRGALGGGRQSPSLTGTGDRTTLLQILPLPKMVIDWMK